MAWLTISRDAPRSTALSEAADRAWDQALADFYYPPLPDVIVEHRKDASSYFYIDTNDWTVHLNTAGVPIHLDLNESEPYLRSVCHHEIQHYLVCPYDAVMNGMMFAAARRHVNDVTALFICNLFADLVVDSALLRRFPRLTHSRIIANIFGSAMMGQIHSPLWTLIVSCYRAMWGFPLPSSVKVDEETYEAAEAIVRVARKHIDTERKWPKAVEAIAKIVAKWQPEEDESLAGCSPASGFEAGSASKESDTILVPLDVDAVVGNPIEVRNGGMARRCMEGGNEEDLEREMERLAIEVEQRNGNLRDLEGVYLIAGIGSKRKAWIRFWYRAKVRGLLRFEVREKQRTGLIPLTADTWRLGDPIEELDIVQSLQAFPILVPNMSTRRWLKIEVSGESDTESFPDLLLVIDSSGSMTWSMGPKNVSGPYHTALVSAFAAMDFALRKGSRVAVINFSDGTRDSDWSRERSTSERVLLTYQGGGTQAPIKKIADKCRSAESNVMVLMITDAEIANWDKLMKSISEITRIGHRFFMFHIAPEYFGLSKKTAEALRRAGASIIPVSSPGKLPGLVIKEVRGIYGT
ncbi:MAG: hypothetical protein JSW05_03930 [Candidatus Thorarchaeota archaeon]|nr:MAG: hypothetical protein JSW05_03930 [Candidatus Thorarchaeota archaeon]